MARAYDLHDAMLKLVDLFRQSEDLCNKLVGRQDVEARYTIPAKYQGEVYKQVADSVEGTREDIKKVVDTLKETITALNKMNQKSETMRREAGVK